MSHATNLDSPIPAYARRKIDITPQYHGNWIVFYREEVAGSYDDFESAAEDAIARFGEGPYLIRKAGARPVALPTSVLYGGL